MRSACCLKIPLVALPFETITVNGIFLAPRAGFEEAIEARSASPHDRGGRGNPKKMLFSGDEFPKMHVSGDAGKNVQVASAGGGTASCCV